VLKFGIALLIGMAGVQSVPVPALSGPFAGWTVQNAGPATFTMRDGVLRVEGTDGWLKSNREYGDFTLRGEFRFLTDDTDSGIYVRAVAATPFIRGWPNQSYQVQVRNPRGQSRFPPVGGLFRHGMPDGEISFEPADAARLSKANGEWQAIEIAVIGTGLTVRLNGTEISRATNIGNNRGYVGIQAEAGVIEFRNIEIQER
jgi:hypothetical protein